MRNRFSEDNTGILSKVYAVMIPSHNRRIRSSSADLTDMNIHQVMPGSLSDDRPVSNVI